MGQLLSLAYLAVSAAGAGAAIYSAVKSSKTKTPEVTPTPSAAQTGMDPQIAKQRAKDAADRKRRIQALSGGDTLFTSTLGGSLPEGAAEQKTLLGGG